MTSSIFKKWLPDSIRKSSEIEKLKIFLDSAPGEYFGWSDKSDTLIYSPGFARLFGKDILSSHDDIQNTLEPFDAASFETILNDYKKTHKLTELVVKTEKDRILELSFRWGEINDLHYHVIWAKDITKNHENHKKVKNKSEEYKKEVKNLTNILDALPQAIWIRNSKGNLTWVNKFYSNLFDKTKGKILDEQKNINIKPKDAKIKTTSKNIAKKALETGNIQTITGYGVIGGERYTLELQEKPYANLDITVGLAEDITWKDEFESKSEKTISAYRTILGDLQAAVALYGADKKLEFYNSSFSKLWKLDESWLNTKPTLGSIFEKLRETRRLPEQSDFKRYKQEWLDMFTKLINTHSDMMVLPDGTVLRTQVIPQPMGGLGHIFEDVTTNIELESSYNTLMAVQRETIDNLSEGIIVYGSDGCIKLYNNNFMTIWGINPEDMEEGIHVSKFFDKSKSLWKKDDWEKRKTYVMKVLEERIEECATLKLKNDTILETASVCLPDGGTLITYTDVTDSTRVKDALREKNSALETAEMIKTDFLAKISYQLRTPLSSIIGFNDILDQEYFGTLNDKQKEYTTGIKNAGGNLKNLIDDILDLTSLEAGIICLETEETCICSLLENIRETTQGWADSKQIKVSLDCKKNLGKLNIDRKRIKHAITHLIKNSISFTPLKGSISIEGKKEKSGDGNIIKIIIKDNGAGIPKSELDQVFKPFSQNEQISGGAGLGLTIVKNIVELHNGTIDIESSENKGTTITLSFVL